MTATQTRPGSGGGGGGGGGGAANQRSGAEPVVRNVRGGQATRRTLLTLLASALGVLPLKGLISDSGWLIDVWLTMLIVVGPAALLRRRRAPGALDVWPGVALAVPWLTLRFVPGHALAGLIPTSGTWHDIGLLMNDLHQTTRDEVAPVHSTMAIKLVLCALLGLLAALIDLIAVVGRRGALAGVPLLVVFTVSGAVPRRPVSWVWFVFAAIAFLILLSVNSDDELGRWGRRIGRTDGHRARTAVPISAQRIAAAAIVAAVLLPLLVPAQPRNLIANLFHRHSSGGSGEGFGSGGGISPFIDLKGQLNRKNPVDVLKVKLAGDSSQTPPFYLRSNVLDTYTGTGWRASDHGSSQALNTGYPTDPPTVAAHSRTYQAQITVANLGGDAPLFAVPTDLQGLSSDVRWNSQDQLLTGKDIRGGDSYTEQFIENTPTAADLRESTADFPADMSRWLTLGAGVPQQVHTLVDQLTAGKSTPYDKARAITDFFSNSDNGFQYSLKTKAGDSGSDLVDFLTARIGFCQQYAAATAVMFRLAGIPTRVVLGWEHPVSNDQNEFTINSFDAHSWVEAYFTGIGWVPFDTTPIDGLDGGSKSDLGYAPHAYPSNADDRVSKSQTASNSSSAGATSAAPTTAAPDTSATGTGADHTPAWTGIGILAALLLGLTPGAVRLLRRRRRLAAGRLGDPDTLWAELSDTAIDLGYVWSPARSPRQVAAWLGRDTADDNALIALAHAVEQRRYGSSVDPRDTRELTDGLTRVTAQLRTSRSNGVRLRARLWPASLGLGTVRPGGRLGGRRHR